MKEKEYWDLYDENLKLTDKRVIRDEEEIPDGYYHLSVEIWIINSKKELLILKSDYDYSKFFPGKWKCLTGNLMSGENEYECCNRNAKFKIGIPLNTDKIKVIGIHKKPKYHFAYYTCILEDDIDIESLNLNDNFYINAKFVSKEELNTMQNNGEIAYYLIERIENEVLDYM